MNSIADSVVRYRTTKKVRKQCTIQCTINLATAEAQKVPMRCSVEVSKRLSMHAKHRMFSSVWSPAARTTSDRCCYCSARTYTPSLTETRNEKTSLCFASRDRQTFSYRLNWKWSLIYLSRRSSVLDLLLHMRLYIYSCRNITHTSANSNSLWLWALASPAIGHRGTCPPPSTSS